MQVTLDTPGPITRTLETLQRPQNKVAILAASILLSSLYFGFKLLPISQFYGELVWIAGAGTGWSYFFSNYYDRH
ncbi:MAG: hypothetical protein K1X28_10190 [Parachlamydiales bacterium]|nr:hypothetical protein [Parachlamydiales bacterium]